MDLERVLSKLGVATQSWQGREIRPAHQLDARLADLGYAAVTKKYPDLGDPSPSWEWRVELAETLFWVAITHGIDAGTEPLDIRFVGDDITTERGILLMQTLKECSNGLYISTLVRLADRALEAREPQEALKFYRQALEESFRPSLQVELGCLFLHRAGAKERLSAQLEPFVLSELDLSDDTGVELLKRVDLLKPFAEESGIKSELLRLALEAYGRPYGYNTWRASRPGHIRNADDIFFSQCLVLDGLKAVFLAMDKAQEARLTSIVFHIWSDVVEGQNGDLYPAFNLRFGFFEGVERGRELERSVQLAIAETRQTVVLGDPDAFSDSVAEKVLRRQRLVPEQSRQEIDNNLRESMGEVWNALPGTIRQRLIDAEYDLSTEPSGHTHLGVILQYASIVEALLKERSGKRWKLAEFVKNLDGHFGKLMLKPGCQTGSLVRDVDEIRMRRNQFAHGDVQEYRLPSQEDVARVRNLILGDRNLLGLILQCVQKA